MAPLSLRLSAGAYAPVTADEVRELLGWSRERTDALLSKVPRLRAYDGHGRALWKWGSVLDAAEGGPKVIETPRGSVPLDTEITPLRGKRRA